MKTIEFEYYPCASAEEARALAIDWQNYASENSLYMSELAEAGAYFAKLAEQFPELKEEFEENAII